MTGTWTGLSIIKYMYDDETIVIEMIHFNDREYKIYNDENLTQWDIDIECNIYAAKWLLM